MQERSSFVDSWKGVLIALVVLGHVAGGMVHLVESANSVCFEVMHKTIYMFHMPAFFVVAGYLWKDKEESLIAFVAKKARRLLVPYIVFGILSIIVFCLFSGGFIADAINSSQDSFYSRKSAVPVTGMLLSLVHAGGWPQGAGFQMNSVLWFLPAMFSTLFVFWLMRRYLLQHVILYVTVLLSAVLLGFYFKETYLPLGVSHVFYYLPFVAVGCWMRGKVDKWEDKKKWSYLPVVLTCWVCYTLVAVYTPDKAVISKSIFAYTVFYLFAFVGVLLSFKTTKYINSRCLALIGQNSLGIMLIHKFVVLALQFKLSVIKNLATHGGLLVCCGVLGTVTMASLFISILGTMTINSFCPILLGGTRR